VPARKPSALKLLEGTYRPDRSRREPRPPVVIPEPPAWLCEQALEYWRELAPQLEALQVLTSVDRQALTLCCDALAEHRAARGVVARDGATYRTVTEGGSILYRQRPEVGIAQDSWRRALRAMVELGLTPAARGKLDVPSGGAPGYDPLSEFFD
jgi:P27 family predicted phage terminase small subunit